MSDLPPGWEWATVADLGIEAKPGFASGKHNQQSRGILHLRPMNINREGRLDYSDVRHVSDETGQRVQSGDVLFNNTNSPALVGKTALVDTVTPVAYSNHMTRLRLPRGLCSRFIAYQLHALWARGYFRSILENHVNQSSVSTRKLLETVIAVAPANEQHRIADALDAQSSRVSSASNSLTVARQKCVRYLDSLVVAALRGHLSETSDADGSIDHLMAALLTERAIKVKARRRNPLPISESIDFAAPSRWGIASLDSLCWDIQYGSSAKAASEDSGYGVPVVRMGNIQDGELRGESMKYLAVDHPDAAALRLQDGDVLFNRTNSVELVGKSAVYRNSFGPAIFASYLIRCRLLSGISPDWVSLVLNSQSVRQHVRSVASQQVGQANVNGTKLGGIPIPIPSTAEQERIVVAVRGLVSDLNRIKLVVGQAGYQSGALQRALLTDAFSGRLVPQDPTDEPASVLLERIRTEVAAAPKPKRARRGARPDPAQETLP